MKKLLLINPPAPFLAYPNAAPHLGIGYLISYIRARGFHVRYLNLESSEHSQIEVPEGYDYYGITAVTPQYHYAKQIKDIINKNKLGKTIIGGAHASVCWEECLRDGFDFVVKGYGEKALLDILTGRINKKFIAGDPVSNIDELPFPSWDDLLTSKYNYSFGNKTAHIFTTRGCQFDCTHCCSPTIYGNKIYPRSIDNVQEEIKYLINKYHIDSLYFFDPTFTFSKKRTIDLSRKLGEFGLNWTCQTRVDCIDLDILTAMKKAGCNQISFGIEACDEETHNPLGKNTTLNQNIQAIAMAQSVGLKVKSYLMGALPNENWDSLNRAKEFLLKNKPDSWLYSTFIPFPGTSPWFNPEKYGIKIHCRDYRMYYPLGLNGRGPVNISNKYLSQEELVALRDDMLSFLMKEIPNHRVQEAINLYPIQRSNFYRFNDDISEDGFL